jgi:aspartate carbamoyltransferase catalytic subunit
MDKLSVDHLLGIKYLNANDIDLIFKTADHFKEVINRPIKKVPSLRDITIANVFFENSTRTKLSFELAEKRLSADVINFSSGSSSVKKGETLLDTVNNILSMKVDMIVMRHASPGAPHFLSRHIDANIVNAGDGTHEHPTQALLDTLTIRRHKGHIEGLNVVICGDIAHSRVARSATMALHLLGANVRLVAPKTLLPAGTKTWGATSAGTDFDVALNEADVVMMLRLQMERMDGAYLPSRREYFRFYGLTAERLAKAKPDALVMHPGPMNRGIEIESAIADGPQSVITEQVEMGVAVREAVLHLLAGEAA